MKKYGIFWLRILILPCAALVVLISSTMHSRIIEQQAAPGSLFEDNFESGIARWQTNRNTISVVNRDGPVGPAIVGVNNPGPSTITYMTYRLNSPMQAIASAFIYDDMSNNQSYTFLSITDDANSQGMSIGIRPATSTEHYVYCPTANQSGCMDTGKKRSRGWHQFKLFVTPKGAYGKIDNDSFGHLPANNINGPVNVAFLQFQKVNIGVQFAESTRFFDGVSIDVFPAPPASDFDIAMGFIDTFLSSYGAIDVGRVDQMIKNREGEFCPVDYTTGNCPTDNSAKPPKWHYMEQLIHVYVSLLHTAGAHEIRYLKTGNASDLAKAIRILEYVDTEYTRWSKYKNSGYMTSSLIVYASIIWDKLPPSLQQSIKAHITVEAEFFASQFRPYSSHIGNSSGEENSWPAGFLSYVYLAFPDLPNANKYFEQSKFYAFHSLTRGETYGGFTSRTIYDDYIMDNHDYHPHPGYGIGVAGSKAAISLMTKKYYPNTIPEYTHNALPVWKKMQEFIDYRTLRFKGNKISKTTGTGNVFYPGGLDDWGTDAGGITTPRFIKDEFGYNTFTDPETGFSTGDLARHVLEYTYYIKKGYLWRSERPNVQFTEMLIDHGLAHYFPGWQDVESYRWFRNTNALWDYISYFYFFDPSIRVRSRDGDSVPTVTPVNPSSTIIPTATIPPSPTPVPIYDMCSYVTVLAGGEIQNGEQPLILQGDKRVISLPSGNSLDIIAVPRETFQIKDFTFQFSDNTKSGDVVAEKKSGRGTIHLTYNELAQLIPGTNAIKVQVMFSDVYGSTSVVNNNCSVVISLAGVVPTAVVATPTPDVPPVSSSTGLLIGAAGLLAVIVVAGVFFFKH